MRAGHRLQQEHGDKSSLFSPSEFAESVNCICCLLFCFRWAVVFPRKMPSVSLTGLDNSLTWLLPLNFEFSRYCGSALLSCICSSSWLFSLGSAVLPRSCASASEWPVSVSRAVPWGCRKRLLAGRELLENQWELVASQSCCWAVQAAQNRPRTQLSASSNLFVLLAVLCTY